MTKKQNSTSTKTQEKQAQTEKKKPEARLSNVVKPDNMSLEEWQRTLRRQAAEREMLGVQAVDARLCPGEYRVINPKSKEEYKVVFRGENSSWNYCSCMDFKTSQLGTCKHLEAVKLKMKEGRRVVATPSYSSVYLSYRDGRKVSIRIGSNHREEMEQLAKQYFDSHGHLRDEAISHFDHFLSAAAHFDSDFRCYSDAIDYVVDLREGLQRRTLIEEKYTDAQIDTLLDTQLYPYQKEGIRFAATAGRAIIADEMGLGKTIQAIGTAELLRREGFVENVLIVCPTSLKYQWKREIERFTHREVLVIEGPHTRRLEQYKMEQPYKIVSYNSVCNDLKVLRRMETDMVIMDEVQRLKNWDTQIARAARHISSPYAVLLSGTPLENKLEELYSIVELVDQFALAPYYKFRNDHIIIEDNGKVVGYRNLNSIKQRLSHIMLRRRKSDVHLQLPDRMDQNLFVPMTAEQREMHDEFRSGVAALVLKWKRMHFLSEKDRKRLLLLLSQMRMVCDSTFILDQESRYDTKIDELMNLLDSFMEGGDGKAVVFSGWERMTRLVAQELTHRGVKFEYLHGGIPSAKRKDLVNNFTDLPDCRVFLSTDAGSTGLNLQAASLIVNLDLPWNPAVLEQRIARIYRIGQQRNIQVINLVSANSFEEQMIARLKFKSSLFEGALDGGEDTIFANDDKFKGIMSMVAEYVEDMSEQESDTSEPQATTDEETETQRNVSGTQTSLFDEVDPPVNPSEQSDYSGHADYPANSANSDHLPTTNPADLVSQGTTFLTNLVHTLSNPEQTQQLVDTLVSEDPNTGKATLNIPVPDKQTVHQFLSILSQFIKH
jgi:SNF2 family DNA or RNA helicase